jgi:hypothetical protein
MGTLLSEKDGIGKMACTQRQEMTHSAIGKISLVEGIQMKLRRLVLVLCVVGASGEQAFADNSAAKLYHDSNRDNIIRNWQAKVSPDPRCAGFKDRFHAVGSRFDNAANASFSIEMSKVWEATKAAKCAGSV